MWKFDIEYWEFESLNQVIRSGVLRQVKQLAFELHMPIFQRRGISALLYQTTYEMLLELERQGFRKFRCDINKTHNYTNTRTARRSPGCCFEMYYINLRFMKQEENNLSSKMYNIFIWCPTIHVSHVFIAGYHLYQFSPGPFGGKMADEICKSIFFNENIWISIKISLKFVPRGPIHNNSALIQVMVWRRTGDKPLP